MATYKNTDKIISHLNDEIEACGNPNIDNEPIAFGTKLGLLSAKSFIETAETADVQEVRHGEWITVGEGIAERTICSNCKSQKGGFIKPPFCNQCGAKMDGKET